MSKCWISVVLVVSVSAWAQASPEGLWKTVDDDTGEAKSLVRIESSPSGLVGKVEKSLAAKPSRTVCDLCTDERKNQPIIGMTIIKGAKLGDDGKAWVGGEILDPNNGKVYRLELLPVDEGKRLRVRGFFGPFYRTQIWHRQ